MKLMNDIKIATRWRSTLSISVSAFIALLMLGAVESAQAQWATNGTNINNTNSGNVGIGTTTPNAQLEINKNQSVGTTLIVDNGYTSTNNAAYSGFWFRQAGANRFFFGSLNDNNTANVGGAGAIQFWNFANGPMLFSTNNTEAMRISAAGKVGIGTTSPSNSLDISSNQNAVVNLIGLNNPSNGSSAQGALSFFEGATAKAKFGVNSSTASSYVGGANALQIWNFQNASIVFGTNSAERLRIDSGGNVGIGTTSPTVKLDVNGTVNATGLTVNGTAVSGSQWATSGTTINYASGNVGIGTTSPTVKLDVNGTVNATGLTVNGTAVSGSQWATSGTTINYASGNVGIGTTSPTVKLDVNGTVNATGLTVNGTAVSGSQWATSGTTINYASGNVGIGTSTPSTKLHVVGDGRITGNLTVDGNLAAKYQDVAEWVQSSQALPAGTVVVLDHTRSNQVIASSQAYDTRVAGVISLQPGISLGEGGAGKVLVATTGRVRIKVDASSGPIHIGDLLVTSDVPGVAMKSQPVSIGGVQIHRPGTLIGKALESLESGKGEMLVLLSLQ
jgi:hypothetical protein